MPEALWDTLGTNNGKDHTTTDKKGKICQRKGSTNLVEVYIRKYSSPLKFSLWFATAIWEKEIGKKTKTDDDADQVTIKTREK